MAPSVKLSEKPTPRVRLPRWARLPFIGLSIRITRSSDPHLEGMEGMIIEETKKTLTILTPQGKKRKVLKRVIWFRSCSHDEEIDGKRVEKRPEDRISLKG